jgi:uncharacterized membrane protein
MLSQPFFTPAILIFVMAIPLILGWMPRNRIYGIRTSETLANDAIWYRANQFGGWAFLVSSIIYLTIAIFVPNFPPPQDNMLIWLLHLTAFTAPLIASILLTRKYLKDLKNKDI